MKFERRNATSILENVKKSLMEAFSFMLPLLSIVLIWQLIVELKIISPRLLPPPSQIAQTFLELSSQQTGGVPILLIHLYKSFIRIALGLSAAVLFGVTLGMLMGVNRVIYRMLQPIISFLIPIPTLAWVPILLIWTGIGDKTIIITVFLGAFFVIVYNTANGVRNVDRHLIWAAQIMGANKWTLFTKVLLPGSLVSVITGLRLAVGYSWRALVGAEMLAATAWGLGYMVFAARALMAVNVMFVGLILIMVTGFIMENCIMVPLQRRTIERWGMVREM